MDIKSEIQTITNAVYGDEIRTAMISIFNKMCAENSNMNTATDTLTQFIGCTNCVKTNRNFTSTDGWRTYVTDSTKGSFEANNNNMVITVNANSNYPIYGDLSKSFYSSNTSVFQKDTFLLKAILINNDYTQLKVKTLLGSTAQNSRYFMKKTNAVAGNYDLDASNECVWTINAQSKAEIWVAFNTNVATTFATGSGSAFNQIGVSAINDSATTTGSLAIKRIDVFNCLD